MQASYTHGTLSTLVCTMFLNFPLILRMLMLSKSSALHRAPRPAFAPSRGRSRLLRFPQTMRKNRRTCRIARKVCAKQTSFSTILNIVLVGGCDPDKPQPVSGRRFGFPAKGSVPTWSHCVAGMSSLRLGPFSQTGPSQPSLTKGTRRSRPAELPLTPPLPYFHSV